MPHIVRKAFDEGYNFASNLISMKSLHKKLWAFKILEVPIQGILELSSWESANKMTFEYRPHGQAQGIL
jgi:hypothetical protein